jgi:hypothetical protein
MSLWGLPARRNWVKEPTAFAGIEIAGQGSWPAAAASGRTGDGGPTAEPA